MQQVSYHKAPAYTPPKDGGPSADGPGPLVRQPAVTLEAYGPIEHYWDIEKPCKPDALSSWKGIKKFLSKRLHRAPCPQSSDSALQRATHKALAATRTHAPQAHEAWKTLLDTMHPTPAQTKHLMNSVVEGRRTMIEEVVAQGDTETVILLSKRLPAAFYGQGRVVVGRGDWIAQCRDDEVQGRGVVRCLRLTYDGQLAERQTRKSAAVFPRGEGRMTWREKSESYTGHFSAFGVPDGHGIYEGSNKTHDSWRFEGVWEGSKTRDNSYFGRLWPMYVSRPVDVRGVYRFANGGRYEGPYTGPSPNGLGTLHTGGKSAYRGHFVKGMYEGEGELCLAAADAWKNELANAPPAAVSGTFRGTWRRGVLLSGQADCVLTDGATYAGPVHNGYIDGPGRMVWPNGVQYAGSFSRSDLYGTGTITWADGRQDSGHFVGQERWLDGRHRGECNIAHGDDTGVRFAYDPAGCPDITTRIRLG